jgi:hypothetical protein
MPPARHSGIQPAAAPSDQREHRPVITATGLQICTPTGNSAGEQNNPIRAQKMAATQEAGGVHIGGSASVLPYVIRHLA